MSLRQDMATRQVDVVQKDEEGRVPRAIRITRKKKKDMN